VQANPRTFVYPWFLPVPSDVPTQRSQTGLIKIGYHGNRQHLEAMVDTVTPALEAVASEIEFIAVFNMRSARRWRRSRPKGVKITEIQWDAQTWMQSISNCNIGFIPALLPERPRISPQWVSRMTTRAGLNATGRNALDFRLRFKFTTNLNRVYPFFAMHIPIVADLFPYSANVIEQGKTGFLAHDRSSWTYALQWLVVNPERATMMGAASNQAWPGHLTPHSIAHRFLKWLIG